MPVFPPLVSPEELLGLLGDEQLRIDHRGGIVAHAAGADRMMDRIGLRADIGGKFRVAHGGASHSNRSSNVRAANRVRTTTAPNANAPQPTSTNARDLICTSATSREMA